MRKPFSIGEKWKEGIKRKKRRKFMKLEESEKNDERRKEGNE